MCYFLFVGNYTCFIPAGKEHSGTIENPEGYDFGVFFGLITALVSIQPLADIEYRYTCHDGNEDFQEHSGTPFLSPV
jgi:hypothetical protein